MNALELFLLGRKLMKLGEQAIPTTAGFHQLPTSVRSILIDVFEHPNSSVGEITARTGFPQSHVSVAVARLREGGALVTTVDPNDRRRTLVRPSSQVPRRAARLISAPIDAALAAALGTDDPGEVEQVVAALQALAQRLTPSETEPSQGLPGPPRPRRPEDFDAPYTGTPPWDIGRPQPALLELAQAGALQGQVLDVGCGTGEHALLAAGLGLQATGIDAAPAAIAIAQGKARDRGLPARFLVWDALQLAALNEQFDTVLDCGLFHVFDDDDRPRFVDGLRAAIRPGGRYYMLCFSDRQPGHLGPRRVSKDEIRASFDHGWQVDSIEPAKFDLTIDRGSALAWLAAITRR
jgi:SAM-dependent methyltransferase/DNA-binding MarR family transcriptional regulator